MICANCGTENEAGRKFCKECAARLVAVCPTCGFTNAPDAKFCGECASALHGDGAGGATGAGAAISDRTASAEPGGPSAAVAPVAERRLVSVLFADLVGFTTLSEGVDPEETRELLARYFDLATDVITRYGGAVEKFIGDAVMAVWGTPITHEDDAERAVRAGLELVDSVRALGPGIRARAGVLTGEAAVTLGATNQGMVAGDLVNTASRLQGAASPGSVLVGESTMRATSGAIVYEPGGTQALKGKVAPVPAWIARRVVAQIGGRNRSESLEAPFVGRDEELRLLKELFHATGRDRRARLVSVLGPAGIGKSRLAWEFLKYIDGLIEGVYWHAGRSPAYGDGITFWALGEMVRERCGLLETDDEATTRTKVADTVARWMPDPDERRWVEAALLALLGVEARVISEELFAAWRTFFERIAADGSVVLVFEDIQYADSGLLDFIDDLLEWSKGLPIYILTLSRPELLDRRPGWGAGKRNFTSLTLESLPNPEMRSLLAGLVPGLPDAAAKAIVARADGIPLYAVETVRMLVGNGLLTDVDGRYVPTGDLTNLAVPETLTALIAARLDSLDPADRALVTDCAVLGQSFTPAAVAAVSGIDAATLEPRLRSLVRRELLTLENDPRSPERGQYAFVQALIREVAYRTLAKRDRRARHLAAARFFESLDTDELAGALAGHYLAAHENSTPGREADTLATQARIALRAAADRAAALGANAQAAAFLEQALAVATDEAEQADLMERAGEAAFSAGQYDHAEALLRRGLELRRRGKDRLAIANATTLLARALITTFRPAPATELLEPVIAEFADLKDEPAMVGLRAELARASFFAGDSRRAVEISDSVLEAAERLDLIPVIADGLVTMGTALGNLGRMYQARAMLEAGERLAEEHGLSVTVLRALINRSNVEMDIRTSLDVSRRALALARRTGRRRQAIVAYGNSTESAIRLGEWDWLETESAVVLSEDLAPDDRAFVIGTRLQARAFRGEPTGEEFAEIQAVLKTRTDPQSIGAIHDSRALIAFGEGRYADARDDYFRQAEIDVLNTPYALPNAARTALWTGDAAGATRALALLDATGIHRSSLEASRVTIRAGLAALDGRRGESLALYRDALRSWRELGLVWDEALTAIDMATCLGPSESDVVAAAESARAILLRLGARPFVARLDELMSRGEPDTRARPATVRTRVDEAATPLA